ncbi:MAG: SusE domain-containing protein [Vicingaceae bacterium]
MKQLLPLLILLASHQMVEAQLRIDSSFAFSSNPAKKYSIYVPSAYNASSANEMMVGFHPFNTLRWNAQSWCDTLLAFAEMNDLLLICPDGDSDGDVTDSVDYAFTLALMDSARKWFNVDTGRVYAIGFSVGGKAVYEFGLEHAGLFGGFIPVGAAVNGSSFVSSTISKSGRKPFYLVHGSLDVPNTRFFPMLTALNANCAYVDSNYMIGVGHTIDFPNRNQHLSAAYKWVDSVNLAPKTGTFSLVSPISFSSIELKGFHELTHQFAWKKSSLADNCGVMKYEIMFDYPGAGFANPLLVANADNNGEDTVFTITNHQADSALSSVGLPFNTATALEWTVRSVLLGKYSDTAKAFTVVVTRKTLGFNLTSPSNNNVVTLEGGQNKLFDWSDLNHYASVKYKLEFDDTSGNFSNPLYSGFSPNNGANSNYSIGHEELYYGLFFDNNYAIGDSLHLQWTASAEDSAYREYASSNRNILLIRGNIGFSLVFPQNNVLIQSKKGSNYSFFWDSVPRDNVTYEWLFDTIGADLTDSASFQLRSDNGGMNAHFLADFAFLDSIMNFYGVDYLDTLKGKWTIRALKNGNLEYSLETYSLNILRAHPVGINQLGLADQVSVIPNPADEGVWIKWPNNWSVDQLEVRDMSGRKLISSRPMGIGMAELQVTNLENGAYILVLINAEQQINLRFLVQH